MAACFNSTKAPSTFGGQPKLVGLKDLTVSAGPVKPCQKAAANVGVHQTHATTIHYLWSPCWHFRTCRCSHFRDQKRLMIPSPLGLSANRIAVSVLLSTSSLSTILEQLRYLISKTWYRTWLGLNVFSVLSLHRIPRDWRKRVTMI